MKSAAEQESPLNEENFGEMLIKPEFTPFLSKKMIYTWIEPSVLHNSTADHWCIQSHIKEDIGRTNDQLS